MTKQEFISLYARFHFHVINESDWEKVKLKSEAYTKATEIIEWEASILYDELVRLKVISTNDIEPQA